MQRLSPWWNKVSGPVIC